MKSLSGVMVPIVTPLTRAGSLDGGGVERLVERVVSGGAHTVLAAGTTGEYLALRREVRVELFSRVVEAVAGRVPVVAGIGANCLEDIIYYAEAARKAGISFVSLQPPSYFPMDDRMVAELYRAVADAVPLPVMLYNIPQFSGNAVGPAVVASLSGDGRFIGIKDSGGDLEYFRRILEARARDTFSVFMGDESLMYQGLKSGADGVVPSAGNVYTALCVQCYGEASSGDWEGARRTQRRLLAETARYNPGRTWYGVVSGLKKMLAAEGVCEEYTAMVFRAGDMRRHNPRGGGRDG